MDLEMEMDAQRLRVEELGQLHGRTFAREEQSTPTPYDPPDHDEDARLHDFAEMEAELVVDSLRVREGLSLSPSQQSALVDAYREAFLGGYRDWKRHGDR
jgi:hypothetical protein